MTKYFYYQKTQTGQWSPTTSDTEPRIKKSDHTQARKVRQVTELNPKLADLTLNELSETYPLTDDTEPAEVAS